LGFYHSDLKAFKLNFDEHLRANPNSEIIGELNRYIMFGRGICEKYQF
jgi:hypothetical protein